MDGLEAKCGKSALKVYAIGVVVRVCVMRTEQQRMSLLCNPTPGALSVHETEVPSSSSTYLLAWLVFVQCSNMEIWQARVSDAVVSAYQASIMQRHWRRRNKNFRLYPLESGAWSKSAAYFYRVDTLWRKKTGSTETR